MQTCHTTENQRQREKKIKEKRNLTYRGKKIKITLDFTSEFTQAKRE